MLLENHDELSQRGDREQDSEKEMLIPARRGVENMLEAASREPSIERVIFTSSCVPIFLSCG